MSASPLVSEATSGAVSLAPSTIRLLQIPALALVALTTQHRQMDASGFWEDNSKTALRVLRSALEDRPRSDTPIVGDVAGVSHFRPLAVRLPRETWDSLLPLAVAYHAEPAVVAGAIIGARLGILRAVPPPPAGLPVPIPAPKRRKSSFRSSLSADTVARLLRPPAVGQHPRDQRETEEREGGPIPAGPELRRLREDAGLAQHEAGSLCGLSRGGVWAAEKGRALPSTARLLEAAIRQYVRIKARLLGAAIRQYVRIKTPC